MQGLIADGKEDVSERLACADLGGLHPRNEGRPHGRGEHAVRQGAAAEPLGLPEPLADRAAKAARVRAHLGGGPARGPRRAAVREQHLRETRGARVFLFRALTFFHIAFPATMSHSEFVYVTVLAISCPAFV